MMVSDQPEIVTVVACPPADAAAPADNPFITAALQTLQGKKAVGNRVLRAASVRDLDIALGKLLPRQSRAQVRLQLVGHSISGVLSLGASWLPDAEVVPRAFQYPFYVLDTNPGALGLLAKYAGKITEVMLVGCNVGSASSFGYAVNGRTLTYTLAEVLRCVVRGADDVVAPDEFDARGWYAPSNHHRRPKGWRWVDAAPPVWSDLGIDPVPRSRTDVNEAFEIRAITSSRLPVAVRARLSDIEPGIRIACKHVTTDVPRSALAELTVETDQGPAELLCGGRYLRQGDDYYVIDRNAQLSSAMAGVLWGAEPDTTLTSSSLAG
jgi:hypothetical protein